MTTRAGSRILRSACALGVFGAALLGVTACGGDDQPAAPTTFDLRFASVDVAVATESIEVLVFDPLARETRICEQLLVKRRSRQDLGRPIARLPPTPLCDVLGENLQPIEIGYGTWAFLAIAQRGGTDYLLGCALANVGPGTEKPVITFSFANSTTAQPPATACLDVSQKCKKACE
ncbi:MAG: hypothetical protein U0174_13955 [Polyangiaceae bacterium]